MTASPLRWRAPDIVPGANHSALKFSGYTAHVVGQGRGRGGPPPVPPARPAEGEALKLLKSEPGQHFTQPPSRYTEATLIKALEEKGIGRPSTYAPTISTILDREYVVKEGKNLRTTPLGEVVNDLMKEKFPDIVDSRLHRPHGGAVGRGGRGKGELEGHPLRLLRGL